MVSSINIHEAKTHFSKLLERVSQGEDMVISRAGVPVAGVVGIERYRAPREFAFARGAFEMPDLEAFNAPLPADTLAFFTGQGD